MFTLEFFLILGMGSIAGWIAGRITGQGTKGLAVDMVIGVVGAALATLALPEFLAWGRLPAMFAGSVFFASMLILTIRIFRKYRAQRARRTGRVLPTANV